MASPPDQLANTCITTTSGASVSNYSFIVPLCTDLNRGRLTSGERIEIHIKEHTSDESPVWLSQHCAKANPCKGIEFRNVKLKASKDGEELKTGRCRDVAVGGVKGLKGNGCSGGKEKDG